MVLWTDLILIAIILIIVSIGLYVLIKLLEKIIKKNPEKYIRNDISDDKYHNTMH
jgi:uncharacterized protein YneF (UPF0154 family)